MFCVKCGQEIVEGSQYCTNCGQPVNGGSTAPNQEAVLATQNVKANKGKSKFWLAFLAVVVVIIAFVFIRASDVNSSPEKVAIAVVESEYEVDIDKMVKCVPDFIIREWAVRYDLSENASRNEVAKEIKEDYRYEEPAKVKNIRAEVTDVYDIEDYIIFRELYDYMSDQEYDSISEVARVTVEFTLDGDDESVEVICIKMKNKWYYLKAI